MLKALHVLTMKLSNLSILLLLASCLAVGSEPYSIVWDEFSVSTYEKDLGRIEVHASKNEDGSLNLSVENGGRVYSIQRSLLDDVVDPNIRSISIQVTQPYDETPLTMFSICLFFGDRAKVNYGTKEEPRYRWPQNQVTYEFKDGVINRVIHKNTTKFRVSSCNP